MLLKYYAGIVILLLLTGCLGGNTSDKQTGKHSNADSSSVALLLTDAPFEGYDEVNLLLNRVSMLADEHSDTADEVVLFEGSQAVNLLDLRHHTELFSVKDSVPVGNYRVVRLYSSQNVELVSYKENETDERTQAKLDYEYIDLVSDTPISVTGGETTYLEVDIDLEMSMLSYDEGTGSLYFEPAASMRTFTGESDNKTPQEEQVVNDEADEKKPNLPLISVRGQLREVLAENNEQQGNMLICPSARAANQACTRLVMNEHTQLLSSDMSLIQLEQLVTGASVIVMGHLTQPDGSGQRSISIYTLIEGQRPAINIRGAKITEVTQNKSVTLANGRLASLSENTQIITQEGQFLAAEDFIVPAEVTMFGRFTGGTPEKIALLIVKEKLTDSVVDDKQTSDQVAKTGRVEVIRAEFDQVLESSPAVYQVTLNGESLRVEADKAHLVVTGSGRITTNDSEQAPTDLDHGARVIIRGVFLSKATPESKTGEKAETSENDAQATNEHNKLLRTFVAEHFILHRLPAQRAAHRSDGHPTSNAPGKSKN